MYLEKLLELKNYTEKKKKMIDESPSYNPNLGSVKKLEKEYDVNHNHIFGFSVSDEDRIYLTGFAEFLKTGKII